MNEEMENAYRRDLEETITSNTIQNSEVSQERMDEITNKRRSGIQIPGKIINKRKEYATILGDIAANMSSQSTLVKAVYGFAFKSGVMSPYTVFEKHKRALNTAIEENQSDISDITDVTSELDTQITEKQQWTQDAKSVYEQLSSKKEYHENQLASEKTEAAQCKAQFDAEENPTERDKLRQMFAGYEQSKPMHEKAIRYLDRQINNTLNTFNGFYDDVQDLNEERSYYDNEINILEDNTRTLDNFARELTLLTKAHKGGGMLERILVNNRFMKETIGPAMNVLKELRSKERKDIGKFTSAMGDIKKIRRTKAQKAGANTDLRMQDERKLALERMENLNYQ